MFLLFDRQIIDHPFQFERVSILFLRIRSLELQSSERSSNGAAYRSQYELSKMINDFARWGGLPKSPWSYATFRLPACLFGNRHLLFGTLHGWLPDDSKSDFSTSFPPRHQTSQCAVVLALLELTDESCVLMTSTR
jgi:hypothetical protein